MIFLPNIHCCCSFTKLCPTLCDPMDCRAPGFPVLHYLLEFAHTHVHWGSDAIQPSHSLSSPSPPALNLFSIRVFSNESGNYLSRAMRKTSDKSQEGHFTKYLTNIPQTVKVIKSNKSLRNYHSQEEPK